MSGSRQGGAEPGSPLHLGCLTIEAKARSRRSAGRRGGGVRGGGGPGGKMTTTKIDVDPLLAALFDVPPGVRGPKRPKASAGSGFPPAGTPPGGGGGGGWGGDGGTSRRPSLPHPPDDGVETDTSLLHGESISLTDEEYSDAMSSPSLPEDGPPNLASSAAFRPTGAAASVALPVRLPATEVRDDCAGRGGRESPPLPVRPAMKPPARKASEEYGTLGVGGNGMTPARGMVADGSNFLTGGQRHAHARTHTYAAESRSPDNDGSATSSPKKKKKSKSAIKSLKKLVRRKSKPSSTALSVASSFDENDSVASSPVADPSSYVGDSERSPNAPPNDPLSLDRMSALQAKIGRIRSHVHALEGDLLAARNELARAHQQLHLASMELADVQRAALEAEIGMSKLVRGHPVGGGGGGGGAGSGGTSSPSPSATSSVRLSPLHFLEASPSLRSSSRSGSSDRLHYFTPSSSMRESEDETSDCFTPRSRASSYESFASWSERDHIATPVLDETTPGKPAAGDKDKTPLTKNGKQKRKRRLKVESGGKVSPPVFRLDAGKDTGSIDTPSTAASTQGEPMEKANVDADGGQRDRRVTFFRQESYIRAHDLSVGSNSSEESQLLPLHEIDVSDVLNALFEKGLEFAKDESDRWIPESTTAKVLSKRAKKVASGGEVDGPMGRWPNAAHGAEVLVWTQKCLHEGHGSEYPVVKARGLVPSSARSMVELLLDSERVKQYNKMSLGRVDEHCFAAGVDAASACSRTGIQGAAKIVRSKSQPPVVRKPVELRLLLHARRLASMGGGGGSQYITIGRSVWETEHGTAGTEDTSATRCEMLLSVNLIRDVEAATTGGERWCEITTITHGVSPGIPISIGKRIGLAAAAKYIRDIRAVFEA